MKEFKSNQNSGTKKKEVVINSTGSKKGDGSMKAESNVKTESNYKSESAFSSAYRESPGLPFGDSHKTNGGPFGGGRSNNTSFLGSERSKRKLWVR